MLVLVGRKVAASQHDRLKAAMSQLQAARASSILGLCPGTPAPLPGGSKRREGAS